MLEYITEAFSAPCDTRDDVILIRDRDLIYEGVQVQHFYCMASFRQLCILYL